MKSIFIKIGFFISGIVILGGCIETFAPPEVTSNKTFLVVDGYLNIGEGSSIIRLSWTKNLTDESAWTYEQNAEVVVEGDKGSRFVFTEGSGGAYVLPQQIFNESENFRLSIKTSSGKEYQSDYVPYKKTPPIDSVAYKVAGDRSGVQVYVNTHDNTNQTKFYRWKFEETWQYQSALISSLEVQGEDIVFRTDDIHNCWKTMASTSILIGTSVKLSQDVIQDLPVTFVNASTNKLLIKYSILVKQFALTQDAFDYWTDLAKTTEATGGLFDPQPSLVTGNIHSITDSDDLVFGFFSATSMAQKRIFITPYLGFYPTCLPVDTLPKADAIASGDLIMSDYGYPDVQYITIPPSCGDCRLQGGTNVKPDFWR
ncbi:DUF4249 domain-containing protein [Cytophagaceae bacterium DM2B3-1]|uniref:DUF4249 domain-containing protein n=1 Tax=Xanthocytophaga flava TaxID=3048013 RepID=A0ABT7CF26_9BACT|nr:DUF4249 domain-containing protein [Xanthocytophaga flavus]MDJ1492345.1 DUF4249 domain-containing protein [Xanthocytophaga flavus]